MIPGLGSVLASVELEVAFVKVEAASSPAPGQCSSVRSPVSERDCLVLEAQVPLGVVRALDPVVGSVLVGTPRLHGNLFEHTERSSSFNMSGSLEREENVKIILLSDLKHLS